MPPETDNLKLLELFQEDQADRERVYDTPESLEQLRERDRQRCKRVYVMMELDEIRTKNDLYNAAVILQHGQEPADFLTAHRLAAIAAMLGHRTSRWLMAASMDRFLMSAGHGQIYGTQFEFNQEDRRYQLKLPVQDATMLSFEKEFLGIPAVNDRLKALNERIQAS